MFSTAIFTSSEDNFQTALVQAINDYIQKNKDKYLKRTGVERAQTLKRLLLSLQTEKLSREQLMWRLLSYIKMEHGTGPLDTSTELRMAILNFLVSDKAAKVDEQFISETYNAMYQVELKAMAQCAEVGMWYHIDLQKIEMNAKLRHVENNLSAMSAHAAAPAVEFKDKVLAAIDDYITKANADWYNRLFLKSTGIKRAAELKKFISEQLVGTEKLDDRQLCARILELASMPVGGGQPIFDTSKDLRNAVLISMCDYLKLDERKLLGVINEKAAPFIMPTPSTLGPVVGHVPDYALVSVNIRIAYLQQALGKKPQAANQVIEEQQRSALNLSK